MTLLSIIVGGLVLLAAGVSPLIVGAVCAITLFAIGALSFWSIVADYRYTQRRAHAAFVREVVRQHQRANEARQASACAYCGCCDDPTEICVSCVEAWRAGERA